jgi:hypothetical protein
MVEGVHAAGAGKGEKCVETVVGAGQKRKRGNRTGGGGLDIYPVISLFRYIQWLVCSDKYIHELVCSDASSS